MPGNSVVRIEGLHHVYKKKTAIHSLDLEIPSGCRVGFIGPDGVGKSTLLGIIAGLKKIQRGHVQVLDFDMRLATDRLMACTRVAFMPQGLGQNLYSSLSVFENVDFFGRLYSFPRQERKNRIQRLLNATNLAPFRDRPMEKLSGGMKQKLGLCCSLIHDPALLILDEPTTGVDPLSRRQFWELIEDMRHEHRGMSILIATAYMEEAEHLDWLVMMDEGQILAVGTPQELKEKTGKTSIEETYISLLPAEKRLGHRAFSTKHREASGDGAAIEARHLTKRFGDFTAVDDVSFTIPRGEIFGFVGPNGCGKTTTMKMITGLLHPTDGEAFLFGGKFEVGSIEVRKRIGYMSQMFSLYGELTVRQNLDLHAHLFDLPAGDISQRVRRMADRFNLTDVLDDQAERLPLGIRQRLSLAVATIHEPEILILDEPTSGVDPVARDKFWELLIELSRDHGVTIFVTTHYMHEAGRCDRVALMNNGRVLACDAPGKIIASRNCRTLEEAFIVYIREDLEPKDATAHKMKDERHVPIIAQVPHPHKQKRAFDIRRFAALAWRETLELLRDPLRLTFAILVGPFLLIVYGYGISTDVEKVRFSTLDHDRSPASRSYIEYFSGSRYFDEQNPVRSQSDIDKGFQTNAYTLVIEIPPGFERDLKRDRAPSVGIWIDGTMPFRAENARQYVEALHQYYLADLAKHQGMKNIPSLLQTRYWYNQSTLSRFSIVPGLVATVLMLVSALLTSMGVVREKELGSIANLYTSPITRLEFLWGKQVPYIAMNIVNFLLLVAFVLFIFDVPCKGSYPALFVGALLYIYASTAIGLFVSIFTQTQSAALLAVFVITVIPSFQFSGLITPVSALTGGAIWMSKLFPAAYFLNISVGTFTKVVGFTELLPNFMALLGMSVALTLLSLASMKKQEA
jgi:ribosome-dependent ATPase